MIDILLIILILSAICFCIFAIIYLKKIFEHVEAVQKDVHQFVDDSLPVLNVIEDITRSAGRISEAIEAYWVEFDQYIKTMRVKIADYRPWRKYLNAEIHTMHFIKQLRTISKRIFLTLSK